MNEETTKTQVVAGLMMVTMPIWAPIAHAFLCYLAGV